MYIFFCRFPHTWHKRCMSLAPNPKSQTRPPSPVYLIYISILILDVALTLRRNKYNNTKVKSPDREAGSRGPALGQTHALDGGALPLVLRGSQQSQRRVEVGAMFLAVAAVVRAAAAAQAVHRGASRVLPQVTLLGRLLGQGRGQGLSVAPRGAARTVPGRRHGFRLDVQALIGRQREGGALT